MATKKTISQLKNLEQKLLNRMADSKSSAAEVQAAARKLKQVRDEIEGARTSSYAANLINAALRTVGAHKEATRDVASAVGGMLGSVLAEGRLDAETANDMVQGVVQSALLPLFVTKEVENGGVTIKIQAIEEHWATLEKNPGLLGASVLRALRA